MPLKRHHDHYSLDQLVMGDHGVGHTAFKRINKFNDDKTEQVWELFREEFARASVAEDGEIRTKLARIQKSTDGPQGTGVQDDAGVEALIASLEGHSKYDLVLFELPESPLHDRQDGLRL